MRKNSLIGSLLIFLAACSASDLYKKVRIEIPAFSPFRLDQFQELAITTFLSTPETTGLDLNKELADYFAPEFKKRFHGKVFIRPASFDNEETFQTPEFWKSLDPQSEARLYLTGKAAFSRETRKAVMSRPGDPRQDELAPQRSIAERTVFHLDLAVYLIKAADGEILFTKTFKETRAYTNPRQKSDFAFYDLVQRVRKKLFRPWFGEESLQERYLLTR